MFSVLLSLICLCAPAAPTTIASPTPDAAPEVEITPGRATALSADLILKVIHPDQIRAELMKLAQEMGGFHTALNNQSLRLKLPPTRLNEFLRQASTHGLVMQKTLQRADLTEEIAREEGRLRSKAKIFKKLRTFFDGSNLHATLEIERNMRTLVQEIEQIKGALRVQRERARWAAVTVQFQFRAKAKITYVHSPFDWLNTVDLPRFQREFGRD
ncbi:DUF4349 domain-containing protein [Myxococcota bacterium]|nr:DUF4349 domain-containing protein [Myxococcota bacterium]MBU1432821.1 DUF4349 domain-containing protein [Myxococcota bacterium]MBU1897553.1 DUF4349 domain-containing protein [Myxococcota bacterium]